MRTIENLKYRTRDDRHLNAAKRVVIAEQIVKQIDELLELSVPSSTRHRELTQAKESMVRYHKHANKN